jgi:hypothetical protein
MKEMLKNLFSSNEIRFSAIVLVMFIFSAIGGRQCFTIGDIATNVKDVVINCIWALAGYNGIKAIAAEAGGYFTSKITNGKGE